MTTGNLRRSAQLLFAGLIPRYDALALHDSGLLAVISLCFLAGAVAGGFITRTVGDGALWGAVLLLGAAFAEIVRRARHDAGGGAGKTEAAARDASAGRTEDGR